MDTNTNPLDTSSAAPLAPTWGLRPLADVTPLACWGARAIYHTSRQVWHKRGPRGGKQGYYERVPAVVDLLHDRVGASGANAPLKVLGKWLDKAALPMLRKQIDLDGMSEDVVTIVAEAGGYQCTLIATPMGSGGYLYIGAWIARGEGKS